jgi:REP element-mobilizing transposase RayT
MSGEYSNLNQRLANLSAETTAQAIILLRRKQLVAYTSSLSSSTIQELVELINSFSRISAQNLQKLVASGQSKIGNGDIVRLIQLQSTQSRHFLYAISLSRDVVLALVFDQGTRFSIVRRQTHFVAQNLLAPERKTSLEYRTGAGVDRLKSATPVESAVSEVSVDTQKNPPSSPQPELPHITSSSVSDASTPLEPSLIENTKPDPDNLIIASERIFETGEEETTAEASNIEDVESSGYHDSAELEDQPASESLGTKQAEGDKPDETSVEISSSHYITYSCLLIPRMPQHLLTSNLASYLFKWMGQLCLAYGWRLEHLSIHSSHIEWIAGAPITTSPAFLVRTLRQKTSQYIFTHFPPLTNENPSGDFWAPGFYISGGKKSFQPHLIDRFINEIREQQGVYNSALYQ